MGTTHRGRVARMMRATWGLLTLRMIHRKARILLLALLLAKILDLLSHGLP